MIKLHEMKSIAVLVLPLMAAFLAQKGMQFIDTIMMGWIGPEALAAGALGTSVFITVLVFCMGSLSSVGVFIVRAKGANHNHDIQINLQHGLFLALMISVPCMLAVWFAPNALLMIGEDPLIIRNVTYLLHGLVWGLPGFLLFLVMREFIAAFSFTRVVMCVALGSIPLTFIANYVLIYGQYGFPKSGISGIGYAGALIMWFMFLCLWVYSKRHPVLKPYVFLKASGLNWKRCREILQVGIPSGVLLILESSLFLYAAVAMGHFGVDALASHQIAMQLTSITYSIPFALSMATALKVGYSMGARDIHQARRMAVIGLVFGVVITAIIAVFFICTSSQLAGLFLSGNEPGHIEKLATSFLMIAALFQCFDGIQSVANGALRGLKDTVIPMVLSLGCYWILGIGSAYYFAYYTSLGAMGIWYGITLGIFSISIVLTIRLFYRLKYEQRISMQ